MANHYIWGFYEYELKSEEFCFTSIALQTLFQVLPVTSSIDSL